jgi:hypothetical protein
MKHYTGYRHETQSGLNLALVIVHEEGKPSRPLAARREIHNHSPTGFEWGCTGNGPAQLALALAADVLGNDMQAEEVYQQLTTEIVAHLPEGGWSMSEDQLRQAVRTIQDRHRGLMP